MDSCFTNLSFLIAMDDIDSYEPNTFLIVKDNSYLHEPSTSSFYLNPRLGADLGINNTDNEPELECFEEPPRIMGKKFFILLKKFDTCKKKV